MSDHLRPEETTALLCFTLVPEAARRATAHLLRCRPCLYEASKLANGSVKPLPGQSAEYEAAIGRAYRVARRTAARLRRESPLILEIVASLESEGITALGKLPSHVSPLAIFEALLTRSWALRHENPHQMRQLAWLAYQLTDHKSLHRLDFSQLMDLRCRACAELSNAYRVADHLDLADETLVRAMSFYEIGTGDRLLGIRLLGVQASLAADRRQFGLATHSLNLVYRFYRQHGDRHLAGRALISRGLYTGYAGEPERAIDLLGQGLALIDEERDPGLPAIAIHNQLCFMVDCGRFREARKLLFLNQARLQKTGDRINQLKVKWLTGRIEVGLDQLSRAETIFREVRKGFQDAGLGYQAALAGMDLATVLMAQHRVREAQEQVEAAGKVFVALRIQREALGAILMLRKAFEMRAATAQIVEEVTEFLRQLENDPTARFDPEPR